MGSQLSTNKLLLFLCLSLLIALFDVPSGRAEALPNRQPDSTPNACMESPKCKELVTRGEAEHKSGQYAAALESFRAAYAQHPVPLLLFNQARLLHKLGELRVAKAAYEEYLRRSTAGSEEPQRQKARAYLEEVTRVHAEQSASLTAEQTQVFSPGPVPRPLYKKWWFWTAIGGAAVAATAIGLGIGLGLKSSAAPPPPGLEGAMTFNRSF